MTATANPLRGEVDFEWLEKTYVLCLSAHEMVKIERLYDVSILEIGDWLSEQPVRLWKVQAMLWAALRRHHPEITADQALDLIMLDPANLPKIVRRLADAVAMSFPQPAATGAAENPRHASE